MTVVVDDWAEAVRLAIGADPDQPDRALLSRLLDDALSMEEGATTAARLRQRAADLRAATAEFASITATGDQIREATTRALPVVLGMADDIRAKAARLADLEAREAPSDAIAALRAEFVESMAGMRDTVLSAHRERWSAESLTTWLPQYLEAKAGKLKNSKHLDTLRPRVELFARTVGDLPVRDYERRHFEAYRDLLDQTPARWQARFRTDALATAIEGNGKLRTPFPPMGPKSVDDDYLSPLKTFFSWLVNEKRAIEWNPGRGVVSTRTDPQARPDEARLPFRPDDLSRFFRHVVATRPQTSPDYWLPLLALYTGARLNELCQLDPGRIIERDGVWLLDLLTVLDRDEMERLPEAARLKLKSAAARREVPLHDDLVHAGFLDFVKSRRKRAGRLFPTLKPDKHGYYSKDVSRRLNLDVERAGAKRDRVSFYSLRHNFRDALTEAEVPERTGDRVMGHIVKGAQGHYGDPKLKAVEVAAIRRIAFPGVDISPYLDPSTVRRPVRRKKARAAPLADGE
ncbi:tyrosine-type recombinase/integrase [Aureimonas ureilytica]|uniref:tyrosine-type recombinase/integrase n=1 Tax=Aureimonas ureilytica TaxID=401562 RepID=UPI003CE8CB5E